MTDHRPLKTLVLTTAFSRYEFESVSAILTLIIGMVFGAEVIAGRLRQRLL